MKKMTFVAMLFFLTACTGQVVNSTNPQAAPTPAESVPISRHPADAAIPLGKLAVVAASNWIDPIGSLASLDMTQGYKETLALVTTDSSDVVLRSFENLIFAINRFGADSVQVIYPETFGIIANYSVGQGSNPQDIWVASNDKAYLSRLDAQNDPVGTDDLIIIDPMTGQQKGSLDFKNYMNDDGDILSRAGQMVAVENRLFVCLQDLPSDLMQPANSSGKLAVVNMDTDEIVDVLDLSGRNPADITYSPLTGLLYVTLSGVFDNFTTDINDAYGGIEAIDPDTLESQGIVIDDAVLGGYLTEIRLASAHLGFVITGGLNIASFDPTTYAVINTAFYTTDGFYLPDFTIEEGGNLLITERSLTDPGIIVLNSESGEVVAGPIAVGAPPASITFVEE